MLLENGGRSLTFGFASGLNAVLWRSAERDLGESTQSSKKLHLKQNAIELSKTIVTDARDLHDKVSTEKEGLPQQKAPTLEIATIREWLVNSRALIRWTADENMTMNGLTKDHKESRHHLARVLQNEEWSETLRWFVRNRRLNRNVHAGRNLSRPQRVQVRKSCTTSLMLWRVHGSSFVFELSRPFNFLLRLRTLSFLRFVVFF